MLDTVLIPTSAPKLPEDKKPVNPTEEVLQQIEYDAVQLAVRNAAKAAREAGLN